MRLPVKARQNYRQAVCLIALAACCSLLTSCHMFRHKEKQPLYYSAVETQPLEIPSGLDRPASASALVIVTPMAPLPQKEMKIVPPRISSQSTNDKTSSQIHWSAEGAYLLVQDTQKSVYRRLGVAIKRSGMLLSDKNIGKRLSVRILARSKRAAQRLFQPPGVLAAAWRAKLQRQLPGGDTG